MVSVDSHEVLIVASVIVRLTSIAFGCLWSSCCDHDQFLKAVVVYVGFMGV